MAAFSRKLLNDSVLDFDKLCKRYCDAAKNPVCIPCCHPVCIPCCHPVCIPCCPAVCISTLYDFPPPYADTDDDLPDTNAADHPGRTFGVSILLSVSLAVLATVFIVFCFYSAYRFYSRRLSGNRAVRPDPGPDRGPEEEARLEEERGPWVDHPIWYIRTVGLEAAAIRAITVCKYKKGEGLVEGTECSVCLTEFEDGETLRLLPKCNHAFHIPCIDTWLASHTNCPNCRAGIVRSGVLSLQNSGLNPGLLEESTAISELEDEVESAEIFREESEHGNGMQPLRRSVSVDSVSASMISASMASALSAESGKSRDEAPPETAQKGGGSSSEGSTVKRSLSCSAKVFLSRYSRSRGGSSGPQ